MSGLKVPTSLDVLDRINEQYRRAAGVIGPGDLERATPCDGWNVEALIDHVVGGNVFTIASLRGASARSALAQAHATFDDDYGSVSALVATLDDQRHHFASAAGNAERRYAHVAGELTSTEMLRLRVHDVAIHAWDLQVAISSPAGLDPVYVRWAVDELARPDSRTAEHMANRLEHPKNPFELLRAFGRRR